MRLLYENTVIITTSNDDGRFASHVPKGYFAMLTAISSLSLRT